MHELKLTDVLFTNSDCYKQSKRTGSRISHTGILIHSTASKGVMFHTRNGVKGWIDRWNVPGLKKGVHAFIDDEGIFQTLPWTYRAWSVGTGKKGTYNGSHIAIEICEPPAFTKEYQGYFDIVWARLIDACLYLCTKYNIDIDEITDTEIVGHCEAHEQGYASNHADPMHFFPSFGKSMDALRKEVRAAARLTTKPVPPEFTRRLILDNDPRTPHMSGADVKLLQKQLIHLGFKLPKFGADGDYGDETKAAVIAFQKAFCPVSNWGQVGIKTWTALFE